MRQPFWSTLVLVACAGLGAPGALVHAQAPGGPGVWDRTAAATYLDDRIDWWLTWPTAARENGTVCVSCHTAVPYALARPSLDTTGDDPSGTERRLLASVTARVRAWKSIAPFYHDERYGVPKTAQSRGTEAILNALILTRQDAGRDTLDATTRQALDHLWGLQERAGPAAGAWPWLNFGLEPWETEDAQFYGASLAAVAVGYTPKDYRTAPENDVRLDRLRGYLGRRQAHERLFNRLTLLWASTGLDGLLTDDERASIIDAALAAQRDDGGWSLSSLGTWRRSDDTANDTNSDGYATGLVTLALQRTHTPRAGEAITRGLAWLVANQSPSDGSWAATSLNKSREPDTDTGRFMRDVATAYAVMALTEVEQSRLATYHVPSSPENVTWGWFPIERDPVLTIRSGETVRVDTLTHAGSTQREPPETYLGAMGVEPDDILQDVRDFWAARDGRPRDGRSGHVITGPIYIEDAEPGDTLEVAILALETRVPYGVNNTGPISGVFGRSYPGARSGDQPIDMPRKTHLIRTGMVNDREVALFAPDIHVPLAPFMGIMAVAPENPTVGQPGVTVPGVQSSRPPGPFGGNLDVKDLGVGTTLYLPVFHPGARFYVGDPHSAQGDGEVSGTAIEQSLSGVFRFTLHKGRTLRPPRAENDAHHILMGIDLDLDRALRKAVEEVVAFLVEDKGLTPDTALSLASVAVDFRVAEAVDLTQVVTGMVPKDLFLQP